MNRIIVIGCPGSGKSTFARRLGEILQIPVHHLDMMYWNKDRTYVSRDVLCKRIAEAMEGEEWIIDGNYLSTLKMRLEECQTVFMLDYSTEVCVEGILERRGKPRPDMPWVEDEGSVDLEFMQLVVNYNTKTRPLVYELLEEYRHKNIIVFSSREEGEGYLENIKAPDCKKIF